MAAVRVAAFITLLPALLGFGRAKIELTRWRGLISSGLIAIALVGMGLKLSPLMISIPRARRVQMCYESRPQRCAHEVESRKKGA